MDRSVRILFRDSGPDAPVIQVPGRKDSQVLLATAARVQTAYFGDIQGKPVQFLLGKT